MWPGGLTRPLCPAEERERESESERERILWTLLESKVPNMDAW